MIRYLAVGATALAVMTGATLAQERAGITVKVQRDAYQAVNAAGVPVADRDEIYKNARVYTKEYGSMDIQLEDGTNLVVSPNSSLVIDEYVYGGPGSAGSLAISLTKGAMRMASGRMAKASYRINTPVAVIGVRGTTFTLDASSEETGVWVEDGTVVATAGGQNFELTAPAYASCGSGGCVVGPPPPVPVTYPENPGQAGSAGGFGGFDSEESEGSFFE